MHLQVAIRTIGVWIEVQRSNESTVFSTVAENRNPPCPVQFKTIEWGDGKNQNVCSS